MVNKTEDVNEIWRPLKLDGVALKDNKYFISNTQKYKSFTKLGKERIYNCFGNKSKTIIDINGKKKSATFNTMLKSTFPELYIKDFKGKYFKEFSTPSFSKEDLENIKELHKTTGSIIKVAKKYNVHKSTISRLLRGKINVK